MSRRCPAGGWVVATAGLLLLAATSCSAARELRQAAPAAGLLGLTGAPVARQELPTPPEPRSPWELLGVIGRDIVYGEKMESALAH
jgi:hypothetical protein